jgi:hypothetical protein
MSLAPKLDRARQDLEHWQKIAEDPKLSPAEAHMARGLVRSYQAAVAYVDVDRYRLDGAYYCPSHAFLSERN